MHSLSFPIPVSRLLKQLFNVLSTLSISHQYLLPKKTDTDVSTDGCIVAEEIKPLDRTDGNDKIASVPPCALLPSTTAIDVRLLDMIEPFSVVGKPTFNLWERLKSWRALSTQHMVSHSSHLDSLDEKDTHKISKYTKPVKQDIDISYPSLPSPRTPEPIPKSSENTKLGSTSPLQELLLNPVLDDPVRKPRLPIVLCHGLYGFDVRGPATFPMLQMHYWSNVLRVLRKTIGAEVIVTGVPGTGSIASRAEKMDQFLREKAQGQEINLVAHSMGGLDCRHLITHVRPKEYTPVSLTTICTPHRGSPFMDWCTENIGIGKLKHQSKAPVMDSNMEIKDSLLNLPPTSSGTQFTLNSLPSSFTTLLLSIFDSPAYANLTTHYLQNVFNPTTPNDAKVKYYSIAARTGAMSLWHPLWLPKMVLDGVEEKDRVREKAEGHLRSSSLPPLSPWEIDDWGNDGLVSVRSAKWGEFLGTMEGCDHWDIRGSRGLNVDLDWHVDLSLPSAVKNSLSDPFNNMNISLGGSGEGDGWSWRDWGKLVRAWRSEEEKLGKVEGQVVQQLRARGDADDAVVKSSTDKLSAVFDWIVDQVPFGSGDTKDKSSNPSSSIKMVERQKKEETKDPRLKFDLERFYISVSRKLYDDGF